jgi:hypothetical protein
MSDSDVEYTELAAESMAGGGEYDHRWDDICPSCGYDRACGCPMDVSTMTKMSCPSCGGQWWRGWDDVSTRCLHRACGAEGSAVDSGAEVCATRGRR